MATITTHNMSRTRPHRIWEKMKQRCLSPSHHAYHSYGGRKDNPVTVCPEWRESFQTFYQWSMKNGYREDLTLDRIDNEQGGYSPENCRWVDRATQANNRRNNVNVTIDGETKTLRGWAEYAGLEYSTVASRYYQWKQGKDLIRPMSPTKSITINGETKSLMEWARYAGINYEAIKSRYRYGDRGERLIRK